MKSRNETAAKYVKAEEKRMKKMYMLAKTENIYERKSKSMLMKNEEMKN